MAYSGKEIPLATLLLDVEHNLIDQSLTARSAVTPTNGDGFGVGWYGMRPLPGMYHSIHPAWNDFNLHDLAEHIDSRLFLAHVRATSLATVQETNCHPFRHGRWLFVHNGEIAYAEKTRRDLLFEVDPALFGEILGTTDSELMFYLALSLGLEKDPLGALARMVGLVERIGRKHGVEQSMWMTIGLSDGDSIWAVRYASDGDAPTLYHSRDVDDLIALNPKIESALGEDARMVVSEPIGTLTEAWTEIPQASSLHARVGQVEIRPFVPSR
jgi:glutamine amidotransferase